jgi:hypothetical protein
MGLVNLALLIFQGPGLEQNVEGLILNGSMNLEIVTVQRLSLCLRSVHSGPSCSSFAAAYCALSLCILLLLCIINLYLQIRCTLPTWFKIDGN